MKHVIAIVVAVMALAALLPGVAGAQAPDVCPIWYSAEYGTCEGYNPDGPNMPPEPSMETHEVIGYEEHCEVFTKPTTAPGEWVPTVGAQCNPSNQFVRNYERVPLYGDVKPALPPLGVICTGVDASNTPGRCNDDDNPDDVQRRVETTATPVPDTGPDRTPQGTSVLNPPDPPASEGASCPIWYSMQHGSCAGAP